MALLRVEGIEIECPASYKYTRSSLDDGDSSYRDINGVLQRTVIRDDIIKLELSWNSADMDNYAVSVLLEAVKNTFFDVEYYDPYDGEMVTKEFYCGDKTLEMYSFVNDKPVWNKVSFNLICK